MEACLSALRGWIKESFFKDQSQYAFAWLSGSRVLCSLFWHRVTSRGNLVRTKRTRVVKIFVINFPIITGGGGETSQSLFCSRHFTVLRVIKK